MDICWKTILIQLPRSINPFIIYTISRWSPQKTGILEQHQSKEMTTPAWWSHRLSDTITTLLKLCAILVFLGHANKAISTQVHASTQHVSTTLSHQYNLVASSSYTWSRLVWRVMENTNICWHIIYNKGGLSSCSHVHRGKATYIWISTDPAKAGPTLEGVVVVWFTTKCKKQLTDYSQISISL